MNKSKEGYLKNIRSSFWVILATCFTFLFFGPFEMVAGNQESLLYSALDVLPVIIIVSVGIWILGVCTISLFSTKIVKKVLPIIFVLTACGYLQGNYLNPNFGKLTGDTIVWQDYSVPMLVNVMVWSALIGVFYKLRNAPYFPRLVQFGSVLIILMQSVAFIILSFNGTYSYNKIGIYLTEENMYEYSSTDNALVFVLDRFDYDIMEEILSENPEFLKKLDGFTSYTNTVSQYSLTYPGINYMFSNVLNEQGMSKDEYFKNSWNTNNNLFARLNEAGYRTDFYTSTGYIFGNYKPVDGKISNLDQIPREFNQIAIGKRLLRYSLYRYTPVCMKPYFWLSTDTMNYGVISSNSSQFDEYAIDETRYLSGLDEFQLGEEKVFKFFHFQGPHPPYYFNQYGQAYSGEINALEQAKGSLYVVFQILEKLKEEEVYKDAAIIITADHSSDVPPDEPVTRASRMIMFYKPSGVADIEIQYSTAPISQNNIPATILKMVHVDQKADTLPIDEVENDSEILRYHYKCVRSGKTVDKDTIYKYEVSQDASELDNWNLIETYRSNF